MPCSNCLERLIAKKVLVSLGKGMKGLVMNTWQEWRQGCLLGLVLLFSLQTQIDAAEFEWEMQPGGVAVRWGATTLCEYHHTHSEIPRPFFAQLRSLNGERLTRTFPPVSGVDAMDHSLLHPGIWLAFADLNGVDFWRNKGRVLHSGYLVPPRRVNGGMEFSVQERWLDGSDAQVAQSESRFRFATATDVKLSREGWLLFLHTQVKNLERPLHFGGQHEMGLGFRVATPLAVKNGKGAITASHGGRNEKENWGKVARWWDYSANLDGQQTGILAVPDQSLARPVWSHARDYGFIAMNPSGVPAKHDAPGEPFSTEAGTSMHMCFALYFYAFKDDGTWDRSVDAERIQAFMRDWLRTNP
jgi:hypothetical protein